MLRCLFGAWLLAFAACVPAQTLEDARVLRDIGNAIEALKADYPQLAAFDAASVSATKIAYAYHTHAAEHHGGWTSGVPNPNSDGVWLYIDVHDADSTAQIHTQPLAPVQCLGNQRVSFLILEGSATKPVSDAIEKILHEHGVGRCARPRRTPNSAAVRIS